MVTIEECSNGFIVTDVLDDCVANRYVFETQDGDETAFLESIGFMLRKVVSLLGYSGSKHDSHRIKIIIEKQGD